MSPETAEEPRFRSLSARPEEILSGMGEAELREHLRALLTVTDTVLAHQTLPDLLRELLARLRSVISADSATVLLCTEERQHLEVRASNGLEEEVEQHVRIPMGQGIAGTVARRRQAVIVDDVSRAETASPYLRRLSSMMLAPLVVGDETLGVLHVGTRKPRAFKERDLYLLQVVADRVGLAIRNALTYDQRQREVRELARAKEEVVEGRERLRLLFDRSPLPMWVFDLETLRIIDVNEAAIRHYGWSREEFLAMTIQEIRPPSEIPRLQSVLAGGVQGLVQRNLFRHRRRDGSVIDVEVTTRELEYDGRLARIALIVDVTQQRQAAAERERLVAEIERQRRLLQTVTDNATSALMMMDSRGRGSFWNPAAERITGYTAEEAMGRTLHELVHHTRPDGTPFPIEECPIDQALPHGVDVEGYEDVFLRKDGTFFPVVCAAKPIIEEGRAVGTVIEVRDVTAEKAAEEALRRSIEEAEQANRAKGEFLSAMSHELRTPLNAIAGYVDLIDAGVHGPVTDAQRSALERVKRSQEHLLSLINDVLHLIRLEAGRLDFTIGDVSMNALLEEISAIVDTQAQVRGITYSCHPCDPVLSVRADADRVRQILMNVVGNALKFTGPGGRVEVRCDADAQWVYTRVQDTGRGIPPDRLDAIFDPFVQLERHRHETSQQGVGLGLAISRDLARGMGGNLVVESEEGAGSTFMLTLPRAETATS